MKRICTVLSLIVLGLLILVFLIDFLAMRKMEKVDYARSYEHKIASWMEQRVAKTGTLSNIDKGSISSMFSDSHTNAQGEILDPWNTPFQVEIVGQTNFILRSAGPNKNIGDADNIIFNSVSNDFMKP